MPVAGLAEGALPRSWPEVLRLRNIAGVSGLGEGRYKQRKQRYNRGFLSHSESSAMTAQKTIVEHLTDLRRGKFSNVCETLLQDDAKIKLSGLIDELEQIQAAAQELFKEVGDVKLSAPYAPPVGLKSKWGLR